MALQDRRYSVTCHRQQQDLFWVGDSVYALGTDGSLKWRYEVPHDNYSFTSPTVGSGGTIYIGASEGYVYAINSDGSLIWQKRTIGFVEGGVVGPPVIGIDKTIYVGSSTGDGILSAFTEFRGTATANNEWKVSSFKLKSNYPNPFNPSTNIRFELPQAEHVTINIYNTLGQKIETLVNRQMTAGSHSVTFNAEGLSGGVYIYQLKAGNYTESKKMLLLK